MVFVNVLTKSNHSFTSITLDVFPRFRCKLLDIVPLFAPVFLKGAHVFFNAFSHIFDMVNGAINKLLEWFVVLVHQLEPSDYRVRDYKQLLSGVSEGFNAFLTTGEVSLGLFKTFFGALGH